MAKFTINPRRGRRTPERAAFEDRFTTGLLADVVITPAGLARVVDLKHQGGVQDGPANLIKAAEQGSPEADRWQARLAAELGYSDWTALHRAILTDEKAANRRAPHGRIRCEIYALAG